MKTEYETVVSSPAPSFFRRVSWGAIFAGLFVTMVVQIMLSLLGVAIGAASINPTEEQDPVRGLGIPSAIWLLASGLISLFFGAFVAGRLSGGPRRADGMLHGVVTWSVATIVTIFMLASATGAVLGGLGSLVSEALRASQKAPQSSSQTRDAFGSLERAREQSPDAGALLPPTGREQGTQQPAGQLMDLARQDPELAAALLKAERNGGTEQSPADRDQIVNILTTKHNIDQQQATAMITQWDQNFEQLKARTETKAREVGEKVAQGTAQAALWGFIALALGMTIAAWGGWAGTASLPGRLDEIPPSPA